MSGVKRYDVSGFGGGMVEIDDGAWVHVDDHAALESERDELRAQVEAMRIAVSGYLQALDNGEGEYEVRRVRHKMRQSVASLKAKPDHIADAGKMLDDQRGNEHATNP